MQKVEVVMTAPPQLLCCSLQGPERLPCGRPDLSAIVTAEYTAG